MRASAASSPSAGSRPESPDHLHRPGRQHENAVGGTDRLANVRRIGKRPLAVGGGLQNQLKVLERGHLLARRCDPVLQPELACCSNVHQVDPRGQDDVLPQAALVAQPADEVVLVQPLLDDDHGPFGGLVEAGHERSLEAVVDRVAGRLGAASAAWNGSRRRQRRRSA